MHRPTRLLLLAGVAAALTASLSAQNCYENDAQCFSFAPHPDEAPRFDTGINLRSKALRISGDIRFRLRMDNTTEAAAPVRDADQQAARARVKLEYQATEQAMAVVEFNFSETWAGSENYSDARTDENYNKIAQAYLEVNDMLGLGDKWRLGRSEYILGNGMILGSCDFLQYPSTFTGAWLSRNFFGSTDKDGKSVDGPVDVEVFVLDDYGPLQSQIDGTRYAGGTARYTFCECGPVQSIGAFYLDGTRAGDTTSDDWWSGAEAKGQLPAQLDWRLDGAYRGVDQGKDRTAYSARLGRKFEGVLHEVSFTRTDSEGAMHVNPADFNSAGLLHQYAGAWRSDLDTNQLGVSLKPGFGLDVDVNLLDLDRDGTTAQQGEYEVDVIVGKQFPSGVHASAGYGIDDDERQVGYVQVTLFF